MLKSFRTLSDLTSSPKLSMNPTIRTDWDSDVCLVDNPS